MIDAVLVAAFVAWSVATGLSDRRAASRDLTSYFLAGRRSTAWQSGLSMAATQYSADTPMLAAGLVAAGGIGALWRLWSYGIAFLLLGFLLGGAWWRSGVLTDAELCESRYGGRPAAVLRSVKALYFGVVFNCAALAMILAAAVRISEAFLPWQAWLPPPVFSSIESLVAFAGLSLTSDPDADGALARSASNLLSVAAIFGFTLLYSMTGGLRSVMRTDVAQLAVMALATGVYAAYAVGAAGGLGALPERLAQTVGTTTAESLLSFDPRAVAEAGGFMVAAFGVQWLLQMNSDGSGYLAQRCLACRSANEARRAPIVFAFVQILGRSLLWLPILVALLVVIPLEPGQSTSTRELAFVQGIDRLLPPGARGLMLVGLLAALASTLDTHLNWGASYLTHDLYARFLAPRVLGRDARPRELVWVARASSPLLVIVASLVMARLGSIQAAWHVTLALGAGLGVPLLLRWIWRRANAYGEIAALIASGLSAGWLLRSDVSEPGRLLAIGGIGALASVVGSLCTAPESTDLLDAFYERARPPGFWGKRDARRALSRGLVGAAAAAVTLYGALVGLGSALVGTSPGSPGARAIWIVGCLMASLAAIPVWTRRLDEPDPLPDPPPDRSSAMETRRTSRTPPPRP